MAWTTLEDPGQLDTIDTLSQQRPVLIFKHSTRCSISSAALHRLRHAWTSADDIHPAFLLDLLRHRAISNAIAERYAVEHASPQVLIIRGARCIEHRSHFAITYTGTLAALGT
jgi:bacillithiol system protein YtxJ